MPAHTIPCCRCCRCGIFAAGIAVAGIVIIGFVIAGAYKISATAGAGQAVFVICAAKVAETVVVRVNVGTNTIGIVTDAVVVGIYKISAAASAGQAVFVVCAAKVAETVVVRINVGANTIGIVTDSIVVGVHKIAAAPVSTMAAAYITNAVIVCVSMDAPAGNTVAKAIAHGVCTMISAMVPCCKCGCCTGGQ